jgi:hypothetical protein
MKICGNVLWLMYSLAYFYIDQTVSMSMGMCWVPAYFTFPKGHNNQSVI